MPRNTSKKSAKKTPSKKRKKKYYLIVGKRKDYRYGAFPFSEEGRELAEKHLKKIQNSKKELHIISK
jgi:hypothetical protein